MASADIDVEDASILSTIFGDSFPESWRDNPNFTKYLSELSSFGVDKLSREPDRLAEDRSMILEQTQDLASHNYKTFIQTADCSREIFQDFQIIETHVNDVLEKLPTFAEQCTTFLKKAQDINVRRKMNTQTLQRHTQLLEILEMPQLMDTCVRNGYYDEALELAQHVKRLEKKHGNIPVIMSIVREVKQSTQLMLTQLIQQLRASIQLPACLRIIGYLRRMDVFTEAELRIKFLQARDSWLQGLLSAIPKNDPYQHITKVIEVSRVNLFDIITQYRAIFSDDDPLVSGEKDTHNPNTLFYGWVVKKVTEFLQTLESDLAVGTGGRLDSVMGQCMYFGLSFSRVGADFRPLLGPVFQRALMNNLDVGLREANRRFEKALQSYSPRAKPYSSTGYPAQGPLSPPPSLLEFQPLAAYCNNVLSQFNEMRLCASLTLADSVSRRLHESLRIVALSMMSYYRGEESVWGVQERDQFIKFCVSFADVLIPYLNKCLQALFPPKEVALAFGVPVVQILKNQTVGVLCREALVESMSHILPVHVEPEQTKVAPTGTETESLKVVPDASQAPEDAYHEPEYSVVAPVSEATGTESEAQEWPRSSEQTPDDIAKLVAPSMTDGDSENYLVGTNNERINERPTEPELTAKSDLESETKGLVEEHEELPNVGMASNIDTPNMGESDNFLLEMGELEIPEPSQSFEDDSENKNGSPVDLDLNELLSGVTFEEDEGLQD